MTLCNDINFNMKIAEYNIMGKRYYDINKKIKDICIITGQDSIIKRTLIRRCGIIPYTIIDGVKYFCFGIDSKTNNITDFAGGRKRNETFFDGAKREFNEESLGIFKDYYCDFRSKIKVRYKSSYIIFIRFHIDNIQEIYDKYIDKLMYENNSETNGILWLNENQLKEKLQGEEFYSLTKISLLSIINNDPKFFDAYL